MIEGFRHFSFKKCNNPYALWFIFSDLFLFVIDFSVTFFWIPGIFMAVVFHDFIIVGPVTLLLMPLTMTFFLIMLWREKTSVFDENGLKIRKHYGAFIAYMILYSIILSPVCVRGYSQEFLGTERKWK